MLQNILLANLILVSGLTLIGSRASSQNRRTDETGLFLPISDTSLSPEWPSSDPRTCGDLDVENMHLTHPSDLTPENPCEGQETMLVAFTAQHFLVTCDQGRLQAYYDLALGAQGTGKTTEGDRKTPLGTYDLSPARASDRFGLFILIGFPTPEQIAAGLSGSNIGLHGPDRANQCAGLKNVANDWTDGCLAVANDVFIDQIARFVAIHPGVRIDIR